MTAYARTGSPLIDAWLESQPVDDAPIVAGLAGDPPTHGGNGKAAQPDRPAARIERFQPFPTDALPEPLRGFVAAGATAIGCDESYLALPMLTAIAAAIGSTRRIVLKQGWSEPPILWAVIVGESGSIKTPAFKLAVRPVRDLQGRALAAHAEEVRSFELDLARHEKELSRWRRDKGDSDPPEKPESPQAIRYIISDITIEAVAPLLAANPRGLLLARDELAGWLGSFDRYSGGKGGADAAHWLSMHHGEALIVDRKTGPTRTLFVPQAYMSICGGIQPGVLHRALGVEHRESGLAARLLLACPPRMPKRWSDVGISPDAEAVYAQLLARLYNLQHGTGEDGQPCPVFVGMSGEAKRIWVDFFNAHSDEQADLVSELAAAWSKLEAYAARLALIVHYVRWAGGDASLQHPDQVDVESMRRAVRLTEWFKGEARRVYKVLGETEEQRDQRELIEWVQRRGGSATAREVQMGCRWLREAGAAEAALDALAKAGCGVWRDSPTTPKGGRPMRCFYLVNTVNCQQNPTKPGENRGFVDVDSVDTPETQPDSEWGEL